MVSLTDAERDSLTECECGHFANEHSGAGCLATAYDGDDGMVSDDDVCPCTHSPTAINRHAVEAIVAARVRAERDRLLARIEALHKPLRVYGECDHEHTDEDVWAGRAFDVWEIGYTCEFQYEVCLECCTDDGYVSDECATYHSHGEGFPICPTAALLAEERAR